MSSSRSVVNTFTQGKVPPRNLGTRWASNGLTKNEVSVVKSFKSFLAEESGATAIEYALIASLIAVFLIGALSALGTSLSSEFAEVGAALK